MPKEENVDIDNEVDTPADDGATLPGEDNPATETPLKVKVDGVGEVSPSDIKKALDDSKRLAELQKQQSSWEASQHKKGEELNAGLRKVAELNEQLTYKMSELDRALREPRQPEIDPNSIEDPEERRKYEIAKLSKEVAAIRGELGKTAGELQKERELKARNEAGQYWTGKLEDALNRHTEGLSDKEVKTIKRTARGILGEVSADKWTPELFDEAVKEARLAYDDVKLEDRKSYTTAAKERETKNKTVTSGNATGSKIKTRNQFESQEEWIAYLRSRS